VRLTLAARPDRARLIGLDALRFYGGVELAANDRGSLVVRRVLSGSLAADAKLAAGDELQSLLGKKDLEHANRANARWRSVNDVEDLDRFMGMAYSEFDFFVGLRFKSRNGVRRELYLWSILGPSGAL